MGTTTSAAINVTVNTSNAMVYGDEHAHDDDLHRHLFGKLRAAFNQDSVAKD